MKALDIPLIILLGLVTLVTPEPDPQRFRGSGRHTYFDKNHQGIEETKPPSHREGKLFSLFSIVQFANQPCRTLSTTSSNSANRNGTCYTSNECIALGGSASGSCAAGFGVCCLFMISNSGATVRQNCSYIRNPGFPNPYMDINSVQYTIRKCSNNVCFLRLDFESFTLLGTGNTLEADTNEGGTAGGQCLDTFDVQVATNQRIPTICGQNTGQHMYIDVGTMGSDTAALNFAFDGASTVRQWEIKVTQIPCGTDCSKDYQPPPGCLQYLTGVTGQFSTFNFLDSNDNHLANQDYSVCIRQEDGFCCIQYMPCADDNSFSLDVQAAEAEMGTSAVDSECSGDYVGIAGSSSACNQGSNRLPVFSKYCGQFLNPTPMLMASTAICDCTQPFIVDIYTDGLDDTTVMEMDPPMGNMAQSRGLCLTYMQIPCT